MARPRDFRGVERIATTGCLKLERGRGKEPHVQPLSPQLRTGIFSLLSRVFTDAERINASLYDLKAKFDDDSAVLFSFKPVSNDHYRPVVEGGVPKRKDEVDIRLFSTPFKGVYGESVRLETIVRAEDFRIERENFLTGGRKVVSAPDAVGKDMPDWRELDWDDVEAICHIGSNAMVPWLGRLAVALDERPEAEFEQLAATHRLTA